MEYPLQNCKAGLSIIHKQKDKQINKSAEHVTAGPIKYEDFRRLLCLSSRALEG
jgi:hypothetical protein